MAEQKIEQASQAALLARQQLTSKQSEVSEATKRLQEAQAALPKPTTQQNLRQKIGAGLKGMLLRRKVAKAKEALQQRGQVISGYGQQLKEYETQRLKPVEVQIQEAQQRDASFKEAQRAYDRGLSVKSDFQNPYTKGYLKQMYKQQSMAQKAFSQQISDIQANLPKGDKLIIDYQNMRVSGVESATLGQSTRIEDYNKLVSNFNKNTQEIPEIKSIQTDLLKNNLQDRDVPTIGRLKTFTRNVVSTELFPMVSAYSGPSNIDIDPSTKIPYSYNEVQPYQKPGFIEGIKAVFKGERLGGKDVVGATLGTIGSIGSSYAQAAEETLTDINLRAVDMTINPIKYYTAADEGFNKWFGGENYNKINILKPKTTEDYNKLIERLKRKKELQSSWLSPSGVKKGFDWAAEVTLRAGEIGGEGTQKAVDLFGVNKLDSNYQFFFNPEKNPIPRKTAKELISTAYMFAAFEPLMRTGTYQQSQYADEVVETTYKGKKVKVTKADFEKYFKAPEISGKTYKYDISVSEKIKRVNDLLKYTKTSQQRAEILKLAQKSYGKDFIKDYLSQEFNVIDIGATTSVASTPKIVSGQVDDFFKGSIGVELKGISAIETATTTLQPSQVGETNWMSFSAQNLGTNQFQDSLTKQNQKSKLGLDMLSSLRTKQESKQRQNQFLGSLTTQVPRQDFKTGQDILQTPRTNQRTIQTPRTSGMFKDPLRPTPKRPTQPKKPEDPLKIRLPRLRERKKKRKLPLKASQKGEDFLAITKRRGKEVVLGRTKTAKKAAQIARRNVLDKLSATAKVITTKGRQIKLREDKIFRASKTDPLAIVQRRGARLSSLGERREIKISRRKTKPFQI